MIHDKDEAAVKQGRSSTFTLCFAAALPELRRLAMDKGYALAVHGSMRRDLDLIACPWISEACSAPEIAEAIRAHVGGFFGNEEFEPEPAIRPHGRLAWSIYFDADSAKTWTGPYIDLSVMPLAAAPVEKGEEVA